MINQSDINKIKRFTSGFSGAEEDQYVYSLFAKNEGNKEFECQIRKDFNNYLEENQDDDYNLAYLLDRIHHTIHKNENKKTNTVTRTIYQWYSVAAAILLFPLLIAGGIWIVGSNQQETLMAESPVTSTLLAPMGARISFLLPDGTIGWLNSGSSLEYSLPFNYNRQVAVRGEAWFNVAHDTEHPFEIAAGGSKVKVLGTKFNLNAYPDEEYVEVVLEEGKVEFSTNGLSSGVVMKPDERLVFNNGNININFVDASKYSAWKEGKLVFRGDSMDEVARRIGRWYNVDIELGSKELEHYVFRGTFQDDSLEEVLNFLSMTSPIRFNIIERVQLDDGTIQKKKVLLELKN